MIIKHYKGYIDIETIKENTMTNKNGTSAYNLIKYAKEIGFESYGIKLTLDDEFILPCIAYITINNSYNHFVVLYKIDKKNKLVYVNDPSNYKNKYTFEEFNKVYKEVVIILYPKQNIPNYPKMSLCNFILNIIKTSKKQLIQLIIMSLFITIFSIITSFYMQSMVDNIMFSKTLIYMVFMIYLTIYILKLVSEYLRGEILILINEKIDLNLTFDTFKNLISLPYRYYKNHTTGEILSRINDLEIIRNIISAGLINIFIDLPLTIIALICMYIISSKLFIISIIILFLYLLLTILYKKIYERHVDVCQNQKASYTSFMVESINGFETIKGSNQEEKIISKFELSFIDYLEKMASFENSYNNQNFLKEIINNVGFLLIILSGIILVKEEVITLGILFSFNSLLTYFLTPIKNILSMDINIKRAYNALIKIMPILKKDDTKYIINKKFKGDIEFSNVDYVIDERKILDNISFKIKSGSKVLVCGESGSGKSTICKLLKKYYDINKGEILINGININNYKSSDITYVSQNEILFTDTIINNIGSLKTGNICLVDEVVKELKLSYNTLIEENGFNFSGGQKQRMILARSLNNNSQIIIIDEGFSQMGSDMERIILKNIFKSYPKKTFIIISHRLDNIDLFDQVIKIKKGIIFDESKNI